ncbi:hypothetical protein BV20DRAFT_1047923 [Pilatotrama ljubarskyi]|nr:hypothetical protein BV20DRAFT_1047923 [Pilatotrama ljubarskyi]
MASGVRSQKSPSTPELDVANLNNVERLIFAQAVHEFGTNAWPEVAKLLSNHPLISQPKGAFTAQSCPVLHRRLMEEAGLEWSQTDVGPRSEKHLKLAQRYYVARVTELKALIAAEEARFKKLVTEIDEIRSGAWDDKIRAALATDAGKDVLPEGSGESSNEAQPTETEVATEGAVVSVVTTSPESRTEREEHAPIEEDVASEVQEVPPVLEAEDKPEEGSDNEAVDELIGNCTSDKPPENAPEDDTSPASEETPHEEPPGQMEVSDVEEQANVEGSPHPPLGDDAPEDPESPEVPISVAQETASSSRAEGEQIACRKASEEDTLMLEAQRERKRPREDSEPADEDEGTPRTRRRDRSGAGADTPMVSKRFQNVIGMLHSQISAHRYGNIFHNPIKKSEAPDYHDIVKRPMDLKTIKSRVKDGLISNSLEFQRDIYLMFANAMMYNRPGSEIYNMAEEMMLSSEREINAFRQTEGFHRI